MSQPVKTLIVDDDPTILTLLEEVFRTDERLDMHATSNSSEAYERLSEEPFELVITDLMMPQVDGLKILERARKTNPEVLVVIVTGYASLETTLDAIHAGVYDYITKPFRVEEFRLLVNNALSRIRLSQENEDLVAENRENKARIAGLENRIHAQQEELGLLREELGRRGDLLTQTGASAGDRQQRGRLSNYERAQETPGNRHERELARLEALFSEGRLTSDEFEQARQQLKTRI